MNSVISFLLSKQFRLFVILNLIFVVALILFLKGKGDLGHRHAMYFFVAPFFLFLIFSLKNPFYKVMFPVFTLIFIENIVISRIPAGPFLKIGITFVFALTVVISLLYYRKRIKLPPYLIIFWLLFILGAILSIIAGSSSSIDSIFYEIERLITYYLEFFLFFYLGYQAFQKSEDVQKLLFTFLIFGLLTAAGHIFSLSTGINLEAVRGAEAVAEQRNIAEGAWRYGGFFGNSNTMAAFYVMLIPGALLVIFSDKNPIQKSLAGISMLLMVVSMIMSASRGALLYTALSAIIALVFLKIDMKKIFTGAAFLLIILAAANFFLDDIVSEFVEKSFTEMDRKGTESPRWHIWPVAVRIIRDNPLGIGLSPYNFSNTLKIYANLTFANPHSFYLEMFVQTGFLGALSFFSIIAIIVVSNIKAYMRSKNLIHKENFASIFLIILGFLLMGITEPLYSNQYKLNHIFALILGISFSLSFRVLMGQFNEKD